MTNGQTGGFSGIFRAAADSQQLGESDGHCASGAERKSFTFGRFTDCERRIRLAVEEKGDSCMAKPRRRRKVGSKKRKARRDRRKR